MDFLLEHGETIQKEVFWSTANLLNLTVDLIFFDTTNSYFEIDEPGPSDLNSWNLDRVVRVMDRSMSSEENQRILQRGCGQYILGEKLSRNHLNQAGLATPRRFKVVADNLHIKEVFAGQGIGRRRYVIAYNPQQAELDRVNREQILERLSCKLEVLDRKNKTKAQCKLMLHRSMGRYVNELKSGKLKIDKTKVAQDEKLDGKYMQSTSDQHLSAEDIALDCKQLLEVERAFRTLKSTLCLRPVYHSKDDRIRSHVLICWLASSPRFVNLPRNS